MNLMELPDPLFPSEFGISLPHIFNSFQKNVVEFFLSTGAVSDWTPSQFTQFIL